ncbi:hypothetical protein C9374_004192 [Naegleria lovaniensis]|uniref:NAC-A/B domain-containing protein n=1 Tax=Naegleria lovaniensis TaxID=51637 RepID=A0AA88GM20_NAELO|nr:uncharacterized protein C9374_004192 [Naegleria lovaniensis]KAG2383521.1 hypothetical protein C9374_004192 [Naegleria lovaniensis]
MSSDEPKIENVDESVPTLEDVPATTATGEQKESAAAAAARHRQSKAEKKNKKAILKAGLKEYPGCKQVTIRSAQRLTLTIDDPEVFISDNGNGTATFVVFARREEEMPPMEPVEETPEELPENVSESDVQMVVDQTGLTRNQAIRRIKEKGGDIIEAITSVTK